MVAARLTIWEIRYPSIREVSGAIFKWSRVLMWDEDKAEAEAENECCKELGEGLREVS